MKNVIKTDLKRALFHWRFFLVIILIYFVWEFNSRRFSVYDDVLYLFIHVWGRSITPLLCLVITSFVYVASYCEDLEGGFLRYNVIRIGTFRYTVSKLVICFITSFLSMALGTFLFLALKSGDLPLVAKDSISVLNFKGLNCLGALLPDRILLFMGIQICLHGLYCASMGVLSLALSTFIKNSYGVYVLPFLLNYCFFYMFSELSAKYPMLCIEVIYNSSSATYTDHPVVLIGYAILITAIFTALSYYVMHKRIRREFT